MEAGISGHYRRWHRVADDADVEFWVQMADRRAQIGLRLTDRRMRHRDYKVANLPGSLRPTIARALALVTRTDPDDVFLDPLCGAGTILVERALAGRHRLLLGGDIRSGSATATRENFGSRHRPWAVHRWDTARLPLGAATVDKVATNLPWGRQMGTPETVPALYALVLGEVARVLRPWGRAAILTSEWDTLKSALRTVPGLVPLEQYRDIAVLGRRADIFVLQRRPDAG